MIISRRNPITGEWIDKEIDVTDEQMKAWYSGTLIQNAMPNLTDDEREFIMTGILPEQWDEMFNEDKE